MSRDVVADMIARSSARSGGSSSSSSSSSEGRWVINGSSKLSSSKESVQINKQYLNNTIQSTMGHNRREEIKDCWREHNLQKKSYGRSSGKRCREDDYYGSDECNYHFKHDNRHDEHSKPTDEPSSTLSKVVANDLNSLHSEREYWASLKAHKALSADTHAASIPSSPSSSSSSSSSSFTKKHDSSFRKIKKSKKIKDSKKPKKKEKKRKEKKKQKKERKLNDDHEEKDIKSEKERKKPKYDYVEATSCKSTQEMNCRSVVKSDRTGITSEMLSTNIGWKARCGLCTFPKDRCKCR